MNRNGGMTWWMGQVPCITAWPRIFLHCVPAGPSFLPGTLQLTSPQILSCCNRITVLQLWPVVSALQASLLQEQWTCWVGHEVWWSYSPWSKKPTRSCPSLSIYSAVCTCPSSAREVAGQHGSSSGGEQPPYHNPDENQSNLFST